MAINNVIVTLLLYQVLGGGIWPIGLYINHCNVLDMLILTTDQEPRETSYLLVTWRAKMIVKIQFLVLIGMPWLYYNKYCLHVESIFVRVMMLKLAGTLHLYTFVAHIAFM